MAMFPGNINRFHGHPLVPSLRIISLSVESSVKQFISHVLI